MLGGDVVQLERVVLHVVELERRQLGGAGQRFAAQELVGLGPGGEGAAGLGPVAAVPLEEEGPIGPAGGLGPVQQRQQALAVEAARLAGAATPQASSKVGTRSIWAAMRSTTWPAGKWPGQRM